MENLEELRREINTLDKELVELLDRRTDISVRVAEYKKGVSKHIRDFKRESEVIDNVKKISRYPNEISTLYHTIMDLSCAKQREIFGQGEREIVENNQTPFDFFPPVGKEIRIAVQGTRGSFGNKAALLMFGLTDEEETAKKLKFFENFENLFIALENDEVNYAVLPIENNTFGSIYENYDLMARNKVFIVRAEKVPVEHCLLGVQGAKIENIKSVHSHSQALGQCGDFIREHNLKAVSELNTAIAAEKILNLDDVSKAAVASAECAEIYGLEIIKQNIHTNKNNYTRFLCISKNEGKYKDANKISFMTTLPHKTGSLARVLTKFADAGLNLTKLESRPIINEKNIEVLENKAPVEFVFYFDFIGNIASSETAALLNEIKNETILNSGSFEYFGNYYES